MPACTDSPAIGCARRRQFALEIGGLAGREHELARTPERRLAAAAGARLRAAARAADSVSRRADGRRRSGVAPRVLAADRRPVARRHHGARDHALSGRSRALRSRRDHARRDSSRRSARSAELKSTFADRPILEVRGPDPVALMSWLDASPAVEKTSLFGTAVHAVLRSRRTRRRRSTGARATAGLTVTSMTPVVPSLEDVFLDVVDRLERRGAGGVRAHLGGRDRRNCGRSGATAAACSSCCSFRASSCSSTATR